MPSGFRLRQGHGYAHLLASLAHEHGGKVLASRIGTSPGDFEQIKLANRRFPAELIGALYLATGRDRRVLAFITDAIDVCFFDRPHPEVASGVGIAEALLDLEDLVQSIRRHVLSIASGTVPPAAGCALPERKW